MLDLINSLLCGAGGVRIESHMMVLTNGVDFLITAAVLYAKRGKVRACAQRVRLRDKHVDDVSLT